MIRLGVDAFNLAADLRGMGRLVRQTLESLKRSGKAEVTLIARDRAPGFVTPRDLKRTQLDAVWYPWNGMRFAPHAFAIVTINDPFAFTYAHANPVARWREQAPIRRAVRDADLILTISQWSACELQRLFALENRRLHVVQPAIEPFWQPVAAGASRPYILFVAGPDARKNAALLFDAYDAAFPEGPELVVAGTLCEADAQRLRTMRAPHTRVQPTDEQLRALYSGAICVAVPSLAEGYGLPVLEAMACGAPVIAADASALPEACEGAAVLVQPTDRHAWSNALLRVTNDARLRADLRVRGLARVARIDRDGYATALLASVPQSRANAR